MNIFDIALAALLAYSVYSGYRSGLITGIFSFIGLVGGGLLALKYGADLVENFSSTSSRIQSTAIAVALGAFLGHFILGRAAKWFRKNFLWRPLKAVDSLLGVVLHLGKTLILIWIFGELAMILPSEGISKAADQSLIITQISTHGPAILGDFISTVESKLTRQGA
jgi:uncharacterized membrane protein required for colicin V production